jgi:periplasmic divalent cation tolerance protein
MENLMLFYIPVPNPETAKELTRQALDARLAACGNIHGPITSLYEWKSELAEEEEWVLILKTAESRQAELAEWVERHHPYECPAVVRISATANPAFLQWVQEQTS